MHFCFLQISNKISLGSYLESHSQLSDPKAFDLDQTRPREHPEGPCIAVSTNTNIHFLWSFDFASREESVDQRLPIVTSRVMPESRVGNLKWSGSTWVRRSWIPWDWEISGQWIQVWIRDSNLKESLTIIYVRAQRDKKVKRAAQTRCPNHNWNEEKMHGIG